MLPNVQVNRKPQGLAHDWLLWARQGWNFLGSLETHCALTAFLSFIALVEINATAHHGPISYKW
jgi:hypothetical protein